jgi:hypothetical protein
MKTKQLNYKCMKKISILLILLATFAANVHAITRYVKTDGTTLAASAATATSWDDACNNLQAVINASAAGDTIWVAAGTYKPQYTAANYENRLGHTANYPTSNGYRNSAFVLKEGVKIYGGFIGTESNIVDRLLSSPASLTTLSGDLNNNDNTNMAPNEPTRAENAYHVVIAAGNITNATVLDGFTITGGNAYNNPTITVNGQDVNHYSGGGMHNSTNSSPTLTNVTISGNSANSGGGIINNLSSV